jgi:hypothetical protein
MRLEDSEASRPSRRPTHDEVLPCEPYYNTGFQISLRDGVDLAKAVVQCLEKSSEAQKEDTALNGILKSAQELSHYDAPATRTIGIVGDSAAGEVSCSSPSRRLTAE